MVILLSEFPFPKPWNTLPGMYHAYQVGQSDIHAVGRKDLEPQAGLAQVSREARKGTR
jgi:hypothetical protein